MCPVLVHMDSGTSNANVVEGKSGGKNKNKTNWKPKAKENTDFKKKKNLADLACFVCGESGHIVRKCRNRRVRKVMVRKLQMWLLMMLGIMGMSLKFF
jgi:hypothetical protein